MGGINKLRVSFLGLAAILAAGVIIYLCLPKEPRFQNRALSQWVDQALTAEENAPGDLDTDPQWLAASHAVQQIGTNAISCFLQWGSARDSTSKIVFISLVDSLPHSHFHIRLAKEKQMAAYRGFEMLGNKSKPAWQAFVQWTSDRDPDHRVLGVDCLICTGADKEMVVPILLRLIKDPDPTVQKRCARSFALRYRKDAEAAAVFKLFPKLKPVMAKQAATNQPAPNK